MTIPTATEAARASGKNEQRLELERADKAWADISKAVSAAIMAGHCWVRVQHPEESSRAVRESVVPRLEALGYGVTFVPGTLLTQGFVTVSWRGHQ